MQKVYYKQKVYGKAIFGIIKNGGYHLTDIGVYENGVVSAWDSYSLEEFEKKIGRWVVPSVPVGEFLLGFFIEDAKWLYNTDTYMNFIIDIVKSMNSELANFYKPTKEEIERRASSRVKYIGSPIFSKEKQWEHKDGKSERCYYREEGSLYLTRMIFNKDKTIYIEKADKYYSIEEIEELVKANIVDYKPKKNEWIIIESLGEILPNLEKSTFKYKASADFIYNIKDTYNSFCLGENSLNKCRNLYHEYLASPSERLRNALKEAYEAVPEIKRFCLGDMDTRDSDFIRIIYHPEDKREV